LSNAAFNSAASVAGKEEVIPSDAASTIDEVRFMQPPKEWMK